MEKLEKNIREALIYATSEIDTYRIDYLIREKERCHCTVTMIDGTAEHIFELMNEWAEDNGLEEYFWSDNYDDDDIIGMAYDLIHE